MLEKILEYERELFLQLNGIHSLFGDQFMWLYSGFYVWVPLVISFIFILFYSNRTRWKEILLIIATLVLAVTLCDQFASHVCKPYFARFRPTYHPDFMNDVMTVFDYRGGKYGFISSHAANGFGFAMLTSLIFRNKLYSILIMLWATVSAYSRIYLGVHFISDIVPGILTGLFVGWIVYRLFIYSHYKLFTNRQMTHELKIPASLEAIKGIKLIASLLVVTVVLIVIISLLCAAELIPAIKLK